MIKRIIDARLPLITYNPPKVFDLPFFKACSESGGLPVLDTEFFSSEEVIAFIEELSREDFLFGLRVHTGDRVTIDYIKKNFIQNLNLVVFYYDDKKYLESFRFEGTDYRFFIEAVDIELGDTIKKISPHGVIAKGNEASGKVSAYNGFILMQWYLEHVNLPLFVHGGVGMHTAAGIFAAGASGIVLDSQLYLTDESPVSPKFRELVASIEEKDSVLVGETLGRQYRFFAKLGTKVVKDLKNMESVLVGEKDPDVKLYEEIRKHFTALCDDSAAPLQSLFYSGLDASFAVHFVKKSRKLADVIEALFSNVSHMLADVEDFDPMKADSPLAVSHGTRYPVMQGPMANISDSADFAAKVYEGGALPFFALGSLPPNLAENILSEGKEKVEKFGAGLIGIETFNKTISAHLDLVKKYKAPFALFAGGIPGQINELEEAGTKAYLHTPSMMMFENAVKNGCRRFIYEGCEAGGHIGTLTSFVLWELAIERALELSSDVLGELTMIFAGGISTRESSWFISGMTSSLAKMGVKIGVQVGTAYLFTREILDTKAIQPLYQKKILEEKKTIVTGNTVGLVSRTLASPFSEKMLEDEHTRIAEGVSLSERKTTFEHANIGSLLVAAKGFNLSCLDENGKICRFFDDEEQYAQGNYMVGDALAFENSQISIGDVHDRYFSCKKGLSANLGQLEIFSRADNQINDEIAIVGMGTILPDSKDPESLWQNILDKTYSIGTIPEERFDASLYFNEDRSAEDKSYTKIAAVVRDYVFDAERFGYTKEKAHKISRSQQMMLETAYQAVADAGFLEENGQIRGDLKDRTSVVVATCLGNEMGNDLYMKYYYPELKHYLSQMDAFKGLSADEQEKVFSALKDMLEKDHKGFDPVHGVTMNIEASRIAHHMGITGSNYVLDAACATSFAAIDNAIKELLSGSCDAAIVGGVNTNFSPEPLVGFCKMGALSDKGSYPFDERANGFVMGEGAGAFVLKRMKDALRDGDSIRGVIKAMGSSSDGKGKAIAAPNPKGQVLALTRCFDNIKDGTVPGDIDYVEAHGTSTIVGDQAELGTIKAVYDNGSPVGVSSVKSQVGHLLGASGIAGLAKALLAVEKKTLPPNGRFEQLAKKHDIAGTSIYIIDEAKPWEVSQGKTRKAAISSYGFGGINYHCVIEEFSGDYRKIQRSIFEDLSYDFNDDRIVVAGMGVVLPGATNVDEFWKKLVTGESALSSIPDERFHNQQYAQEEDEFHKIPLVKAGVVRDFKFNNAKYRIPPFTTKAIDRAQLFGLEAASQAIESAGLTEVLKSENKVAVVLGTIPGEQNVENVLRVRTDYINREIRNIKGVAGDALAQLADGLSEKIRGRYHKNTEDTIPGLLSNIISGRIANFFGCNAANFVVDSSCASGTVAIDLAMKGLKSKDYDYVLAGGVDTNLYPAVMLAFKRLGLLSNDECRFFDETASGYVMGEGAAVQVLTTYRKAVENKMPILGEIYGVAMKSSVPNHLLSPSEAAYRDVIDACYDKIPVNRNQVSHLDVFGVSNHFLDAVEKQAVEARFDHDIYFGNVKPQFGYFKAANPAVAVSKLLLMNKNRTLLPNNYYSEDTTIVSKDSVLKPLTGKMDVKHKNSLYFATNVHGIGGNHGHMVLGTVPAWLDPERPAQVLPQAKTSVAAASAAASAQPVPAAILNKPVTGNKSLSSSATMKNTGRQSVTVLLSGQGAQHPGMMKELYDTNQNIRSMMDRGEEIFMAERGYSLLEMMFGEDKKINLTENTQPATFLSSAAIYHDLKQKGFVPDNFIGHSIGEYTALYCNEVLSFEEALKLVMMRSELMRDATNSVPGRIMVLFDDAKKAQGLIRESGIANVYVANKNSNSQTAVSGGEKEIDAFCAYLKDKGVTHRKLALSGAFHTPLFASAAEGLTGYLKNLFFRERDYSRIISNVTAQPYPNDVNDVKDLLIRQITSPVEFIKSVEGVYRGGNTLFVEIGPGKILTNLLKSISIVDYTALPAVDPRAGEVKTYQALLDHLEDAGRIFTKVPVAPPKEVKSLDDRQNTIDDVCFSGSDDFDSFKENNEDLLNKLLYQEFRKKKKIAAAEAMSRFDFCIEDIVVAGAAIGLPGTGKKVFESDNFDKIIKGTNFIEPLPLSEKEKIADKNVVRLFKQPDGNARFVEITSTEDVIQLAGQLGYFDLQDEYGIKYKYDLAMSLAIAAGIEALKDANIPLVMQYKEASTGARIPDGFALPEDMQESTGVILASIFPNSETLIEEINKYYYHKFYVKPYEEFENIYYHLMETVKNPEIKEQITDWFFKVKERRKEYSTYKFDRNFILNCCPLGASHMAQFIKAKGPNLNVSGACASTTEAIALAEDWIRTGRCERVIVIGGETPTSSAQAEWIGTSFLSLGAATVKKRVSEAAKPFDEARNGTILGSGAVSLIIEREDLIRERGLRGQAQVMGTHMANSAFHALNIDVSHLAYEMNKFISRIERQHNLDKNDYPGRLLLMSHETFTPARGGSADAEVKALRTCWPDNYQKVVITNTKGYTGHTLGAGIEDAVLVKSMQKGEAPPIANLTHIPEAFSDLNLNRDMHGDYEYGFHMAAGFGSHLAFVFFKRIIERSTVDNAKYHAWLRKITGSSEPALTLIDNTLCAEARGELTAPGAAKAPSMPAPAAAVPAPVARVAAAVPAAPAVPAPAASQVLGPIKEIIAEQTGYTMDMLEDDLDLEADLGIDTVKQVEIFGKISGKFGLAVPEDLQLRDLNTIAKLKEYIEKNTGLVEAAPAAAVAPAAPAASSAGSRVDAVKEVIAEQTGYTIDMLEEELDLEADLGIDTVKQVEIFGKITDKFGLPVPENLQLRDLNTIRRLVEYLDEQLGAEVVTAAAPVADAPAGVSSRMEKVKEIIAEQTGYTMDMLEDDLDLEADLGIDTVKQVEIFGKVSGEFGLAVPEDLQLRDLNTIARLTGYIDDQLGGPVASAPATVAVATPATASAVSSLSKVKEVIAEQTGYTIDMLENDLDLEADLGIDTVKQVEIFGKVSGEFGLAVPEDLQLRDLNTISKLAEYVDSKTGGAAPAPEAPATVTAPASAPAASAGGSADTVLRVKEIVAEQTGYTLDMLEDDLDLEADLGIDTVKQVEIFGKVTTAFGLSVPEDLQLRDLNTIARLAAYIQEQLGGGDDNPPRGGQPVTPAAEAAPSADHMAAVQAIVAEQTGYTVDMLEADLDLEADLGIDTVKQVEIFGKLSAHFGLTVPEDLQLRDLNTIARLSDYISAQAGAPAAAAPSGGATVQAAVKAEAPAIKEESEFPDPALPVKRLSVNARESKLPEGGDTDFSGKTIIVTLDSHGFAKKVVEKIKAKKGEVITVGSSKSADVRMDLTDQDNVSAKVAELKSSHPNVNGLIHLATLDAYFAGEKDGDALVSTAVTSVFTMIKGLYEELDKPGALIGTITFDSVVFPYLPECGPIHPAFAGLAGLLKTVNKELSGARVKVVDFSYKQPKKSVKKIVDTFLKELLSSCTVVESGYRNSKRFTISLKQVVAEKGESFVKEGSRVLVTGGAGGITYEIIHKMAATYKTDLVILASSDIYGLDSKYHAEGLEQPQIMAMVKEDNPGAKPLEIKKGVDRAIKIRKAVKNVEALKALGVKVDYHSVDVRDREAVKAAVASYDRIDGVIHAAGIELSQFIPKKALSEFRLVTDVKVKGLHNLLSAMEGRTYDFFCTFSSVTAKFGNEGQADYTASNDFIAKELLKQSQVHPDRVYKIHDWTAWEGAGMATNPTVIKVLKERGLKFLPLDQGVKYFMADLLDRREKELVITGLDFEFDIDGLLGNPYNGEFPFMDDVVDKSEESITCSRTLDLKRDLFLYDHAMGDVPIFLGSTGIETLAEAATAAIGEVNGKQLTELTDFSIPYGIKILKGRPKELLVSGQRVNGASCKCNISSQFKNPKGVVMGDPTLHYEGMWHFSDEPLKAEKVKLPEFKPVTFDGDVEEIVYHPKRLFMEGLFGTIEEVNSFDEKVLITTVNDSSKKEFFKGVTDPNLKTPAVIVDAMFQTGGLFEFFTTSRTVLPYKIGSLKLHKPVERNKDYYCITEKTSDGDETNTYQLKLTDKKGNLYVSVSDFQMVKLNRLEDEYRVDHMVKY